VQQVEGNVLQPVVMSREVSLHPIAVLVAVTTGALLYGIPGALFAVPVVAVAYRVAAYLRDQRRDRAPGPNTTGGGPADRFAVTDPAPEALSPQSADGGRRDAGFRRRLIRLLRSGREPGQRTNGRRSISS